MLDNCLLENTDEFKEVQKNLFIAYFMDYIKRLFFSSGQKRMFLVII